MKRVLIIMAIICIAFSVSAQNKYAVLIASTGNAQDIPQRDRWNAETSYTAPEEFWNDAFMLWELLQDKDFPRENIFVLYGEDGRDYEENPCYIAPKSPTVPESVDVTYGPADSATVYHVFRAMAGIEPSLNNEIPVLTQNDFLFVWTIGHGGHGYNEDESYFILKDTYFMSDSEFASLVNPISANRKTFWMQQNSAGGFIDNLSSSNTVFIGASDWGEWSFRADDRTPTVSFVVENDTCYHSIDHHVSYHGEFDFHMYSVINGESPNGDDNYAGIPYANGDNAIKDGFVSMYEAYIWTQNHDSQPLETTVYDDLGNIGSHVCLEYPTLLYGCPVWNETHRGKIGVSNNFTVFNGQTVTLTGISDVTLCNNSNFTVEAGGTLIIDGDVTFNGDGNDTLVIRGNLVQNNGSTLSFNNMTVCGYCTGLTISNASFNNTELFYDPTNTNSIAAAQTMGKLTVTNCSFNNPQKTVAIDIKNSLEYKLMGNTIISSGRHGIKLTKCGNSAVSSFSGRIDRRIYGNDISGCAGTGLRMYASTGEVLMNQIHGNGRGVELLNRCNIHQFRGNCSALDGDDTQHIYDNTSYEIYMTSACDPLLTRYNLIEESSFGTTPYVYYDGLIGFGEDPINPSDRGNIDVRLNAWGDYFYGPTHLYSNVSSVGFDYVPLWVMGREDCDPIASFAQVLIMEADSLCEEEEYAAAKALYMQVVENYPSTTSAEIALKTLLPLETLVDDDYAALKVFYLSDTAIASDEALSHLASALANRCDEVLGNYPDAIAWYEGVITDPQTSFADSIFATIELGNLYLAMEENGAKSTGKHTQFKPETIKAFLIGTEKALSLLPADKDNRDRDYINYPFWVDQVTEQPLGFVTDANGDVEISTAEGLAWLPSVVNGLNGCMPNDFEGRTVRLTTDIDLESEAKLRFTPIGSRGHPFKGTFDGGGHTLEGLYIGLNQGGISNEETNLDFGFFGYICHGIVKNITINSGGLANRHLVFGPDYEQYYDGGMVGFADSLSLVDGCIVKIFVSSSGMDVNNLGGVVGLNRNSTIRNCAYVYGNHAIGAGNHAGGIVFKNISEGGYADAEVSNCFYYGYMLECIGGADELGGVVCINETDDSSISNDKRAKVNNCFAESISLMRARYAGAVVGRNLNGSRVENCYGHIWNNYESVGLFGDNEGIAEQCSEFLPTGSCILNEPVQVGNKDAATMLDALNSWVEMQEDASLYKAWEVNENYSIPMFADGITAVNEPESVAEVLFVYPNPATGLIYIEGVEVAQVQLFNTLGQKVKTVLGNNEVNVDDLPQGMYLLRIMAADGTSHVVRVAVSR